MDHKEFMTNMSDLSIVYIEDDINIRKYICEFLSRYCKNIYEASSAEEGYSLYKKHKPQILLVDINLPKMSGMELISLIRENDKNTRVIISTAYTNKEFTIEAIELFITRYLVKPITSIDLVEALKKAINEFSEVFPNFGNIDLGESFFYDRRKRVLFQNLEEISLRKKEMQILEFFIKKNEQIISYESLQNEVWEDEVMTENSIRSQIRNIRQKTHHGIFSNVSGVGYKLYRSEKL